MSEIVLFKEPAEGTVSYVVCSVTGALSETTLMPPVPFMVKLEVVKSSCFGNRNTSEHVLPASSGLMSKLKMLLTVGETVPK